jgi:hypothetical protein
MWGKYCEDTITLLYFLVLSSQTHKNNALGSHPGCRGSVLIPFAKGCSKFPRSVHTRQRLIRLATTIQSSVVSEFQCYGGLALSITVP